MHRHALRDDQWIKIKDFLPGREGHVGGTAADNRLFVNAVIYPYAPKLLVGKEPLPLALWEQLHAERGVIVPQLPLFEGERECLAEVGKCPVAFIGAGGKAGVPALDVGSRNLANPVRSQGRLYIYGDLSRNLYQG